jgi:hypothetical protein
MTIYPIFSYAKYQINCIVGMTALRRIRRGHAGVTRQAPAWPLACRREQTGSRVALKKKGGI